MPVKKMVSDSGKSQAGKNSAALEDETNNLNHDRLAVPDELPEVEEELSADPRPKGKLKIKKVEAPPTKFLPRNSRLFRLTAHILSACPLFFKSGS